MEYNPWGRKESDTTEQLSLHFKFPNVQLIRDQCFSKWSSLYEALLQNHQNIRTVCE